MVPLIIAASRFFYTCIAYCAKKKKKIALYVVGKFIYTLHSSLKCRSIYVKVFMRTTVEKAQHFVYSVRLTHTYDNITYSMYVVHMKCTFMRCVLLIRATVHRDQYCM